jgi:hypothetical protein
MEKSSVIELWKSKGIERGLFEFSCGGDSMNDFSVVFEDIHGNPIECPEITSFFEDEVFKHVDFYENSDGYYLGESGTVYIELTSDEDFEPDFCYSKSAMSEFEEQIETIIDIEVTAEEEVFIKANISNINGGYDENTNVNFSRDFIMSNSDVELLEKLKEKIDTITSNFEPETDYDLQEWYRYDNEELGCDNGILQLRIINSAIFTTESD